MLVKGAPDQWWMQLDPDWQSLVKKLDATREVNPSLAKPPLKFNGGLAKLGLTSLVE